MYSNPYEAQIEQQVLSADPIELVALVLEHLIRSIADARRQLASGDRAARAKSISKALGLLAELSQTLDDERGGEVAHNLRRIYGFVANCLVQAQSRQLERPLKDAMQALAPLCDAWKTLCNTRLEVLGPMPMASGIDASVRLALHA